MSKLSPEVDFRVDVNPGEWENESRFFRGIYTVSLNDHVQVSFVPDASKSCPPWNADLIPAIDRLASEGEARLFQVLTSEHSVTPNARLAGTEEVVELLPRTVSSDLDPWEAEVADWPTAGTVWYVAPQEWPALDADLQDLPDRSIALGRRGGIGCPLYLHMSEMVGTPLARFLNERFVPSGRLAQRELRALCRL